MPALIEMDLALPLYERAIDAALRAEGPQSRLAVDIRLTLANGLMSVGEVDSSKRQLAVALATMRTVGGADDIGAALAEARATYEMFITIFLSRRSISFEEALGTLERIRKRLDERSSRVPEGIPSSHRLRHRFAVSGLGRFRARQRTSGVVCSGAPSSGGGSEHAWADRDISRLVGHASGRS
jgi:integrase